MVTVHYDKPDDEPASDWLGLGLPRALRPGTELERESKKKTMEWKKKGKFEPARRGKNRGPRKVA
jgi:hypothetical protein